jgi:predicted flap endonuclease-1-like 5' DNA nuclease
MLPRDKKPFILLCLFGSLTLLATINMNYLVVNLSDPFTIYFFSDFIGSVPLFPYFVLSLNATIILLTGTLLTLTSVIQDDTEALLQQYLLEYQVVEAQPDALLETTPPLIARARPLLEDPPSRSQLILHSSPSAIKGIGAKTETALQAIGVTTVWEFLVADPEWIAEHTPLTIKRVRQFQDTTYAEVATEAPQPPDPSVITPSTT